MKRIKRRKKKNKSYLVILCVLFLVFVSSGYALLNSELNINAFASLSFVSSSKCDMNISATYNNDNTWGTYDGKNYYHVVLTIFNNDSSNIEDWVMEIKGPSDLVIEAHADDNYMKNGVVTLTPLSWNSHINSGNSLVMDMGFITSEFAFKPDWIKFNGCVIYGEAEENDSIEEEGNASLAIVPSSYSMGIGESTTLQTNIVFYSLTSDIKWSSSNPNVALVDSNGKVTAVGNGTTIITATLDGVSASSVITVNGSVSDIDVKFVVTGSWGSSIQYKITITNNSSNDISNCSFNLGLPSGSSYTIWSANTSSSSNKIIYNNKINSGSSYDIYGQVDLPSGYNINDYLNPVVSNINVN